MEVGDPECGLGLSFWLPNTQMVSVSPLPLPPPCFWEGGQGREEGVERHFFLWASLYWAYPSVIPGITPKDYAFQPGNSCVPPAGALMGTQGPAQGKNVGYRA